MQETDIYARFDGVSREDYLRAVNFGREALLVLTVQIPKGVKSPSSVALHDLPNCGYEERKLMTKLLPELQSYPKTCPGNDDVIVIARQRGFNTVRHVLENQVPIVSNPRLVQQLRFDRELQSACSPYQALRSLTEKSLTEADIFLLFERDLLALNLLQAVLEHRKQAMAKEQIQNWKDGFNIARGNYRFLLDQYFLNEVRI